MEAEHVPDRPDLQPVFIVGVPRSGTTWVMRMLAEHPEAWPLVETYMFSPYRGLGALLRGFPEDPRPEREDPEWLPAGLGRMFSRAELIAELRLLAERWLRMASARDARFVIEKSPGHLAVVALIAEVLPRARFVHIVRDGRDVAVSMVAARRSWSPFQERNARRALRAAADDWAQGMDQGQEARTALGDRLLEIRYEGLHADPRTGAALLFEHCGMPIDDRLLDGVVEQTAFERSERPRGEDRPLRGGRVGDWRERLSVLDARAFERLAGPALRETGYESDPAWWRRRPLRSHL